MDRLNLWENTVVIFTSDHGEMNGAHRMYQKGNIPFDEATIVNLTVCAPGGRKGQRTDTWVRTSTWRRRFWNSPASAKRRSTRAILTSRDAA
jgi:arylsulfatase A-like enzyme